jgi:outer membrane protein assembly factor BamB
LQLKWVLKGGANDLLKHFHSSLSAGAFLNVLVVVALSASEPQTEVPSPGTGVHDWPQHGRTIYRNMVSEETGLPDSFEIGDDLNPPKNIKWVAPLGITVMGVPIIANGKVYISSDAKEGNEKYPAEAKRGALYCLDEKTGAILWQFIGDMKSGITGGQFGLTAAPVVEQDRLYLYGGRLQFFCLTSVGLSGTNTGPFVDEARVYGIHAPFTLDQTDADIVWMFDIKKNIPNIQYHNAYAFSPLVYGDYIYASTGNSAVQDGEYENTNHPPRFNAETPCFMVLDKRTGELVAVDNEKMGRGMIHGQWGLPCVGLVNGKAQILFGGGDGTVYAFDPIPEKVPGEKVGVLKKFWSFDPNFHLGANRRFEIFGAPVCSHNRVFAATSDDWTHKKAGGILVCIDATKTGDVTETGKIWAYRDIGISVGTVSISMGLLYAADLYGKVHCLDEMTGEPYWVYDTKWPIYANTVVAEGKVYVGNSHGDFFIFKEGKAAELLYRTRMKGQINGPCSVANGCLYLAAGKNLYAIQNGAGKK